MLYSCYLLAEYEILSVDNIIKDEENNKKSPSVAKKKNRQCHYQYEISAGAILINN
jgi:hypothetical protein